MKIFKVITLLAAVIGAGCSAEEPTDVQRPVDSGSMPPGFLDSAPPGPESNTKVLSGGTLMTEPPVQDAVVVITDGAVISWGSRGSVDMPNDSIGLDMRGKWIRPVTPLASGAVADLRIYDVEPAEGIEPVGRIQSTEIDLPPAED